jgi:glycosyltransferase involved in cell wall biosynthesis
MRVLLLPSAYLPNVGGIEEVTRRLAAELAGRGDDVWIATNHWPDDAPRHERIGGIDVTRVAFHLPAGNAGQLARFALRAPVSAARFARFVRRLRPDVLHVVGAGPNAAYVAGLRPLLGAPVVLSVHGELSGDAHDAFERSATLRWALKALCRSAAAVTAPSAYTLDELRATFAVRGPTEVVPNGVDAAELAGARRREDLGRYVLTAGRLVPQKGLDVLLRAVARALPGEPRLVVAGDGPERARLVALAAELGIDVVFLGTLSREELAPLFAGADAFVLASRREAFGLVALEAMAAGVPLVATAVGGIPEVAAGAAVLVPPDSVDELALALGRVLGDETLREELVANGRRAAAGHSWSRVADAYQAIYRRVGP